MLAMEVNDNAYCLMKRVAFKSIASKLAPTGWGVVTSSGVVSALQMPATSPNAPLAPGSPR
ncbi:hypothetical protein CRX42_10960 [Pseudomonas jessenii]|uniref:Uncharacterized protein n=1 Tax=Pseudomonas jessenii TaxID=77298 RepID=A0A2W0ESC0_PSEJE|nr:hypothetical protein CRX42_10960 [Pseudomonas jessenii]